MQSKSIQEIQEIYDLEINKIVKTIKKQKANHILLQFPEGLKPYAHIICDEISKRTNCKCFIWFGSCYGGCDIPPLTNKTTDLIIQFGHSEWK